LYYIDVRYIKQKHASSACFYLSRVVGILLTGQYANRYNRYYAVLNLKDEYGKRKQKAINTELEYKPGNKRKAENLSRVKTFLCNTSPLKRIRHKTDSGISWSFICCNYRKHLCTRAIFVKNRNGIEPVRLYGTRDFKSVF